MVAADLHVHTDNSDGTFRLSEVPPAARAAGLDAVAVTDHDRVHPDLDAPVVERDGVTVVHGIELRVEADAQRVDVLGYGVAPTDALLAEIERLQRDRVERGREIIERVEDRLGVSLPVDPEPGLGRPDIARAVVESDDGYDSIPDVFDGLIGEGDPCYVARDIPSFERGRELLADACALVSLAHPLRYPNPRAALDLAPRLDAVEVAYPYGARGHTGANGELAVEDVRAVAERHDLVVTGGSDAHERTLGETGLSTDEYERFRAALGVAP
ncbi:PHP domain-containing protein [Halosimplex pelagicum]|uniref:PHP domain-containing protein n=1 Tax=Halosimplex pelagicum TaxID=869886 RepID=A0A7D5P4D0_9EURY|nr:PHP domain-containing protein [Halosimplex pelagicum]QLH80437.1 PHP domain-containing protein [Halosimplex pelagicum]